jgi:hypothetical protein
MEQKIKAFTAEYSGLVSELATVCQIDLPYSAKMVKTSVTSQSFSALWDTGAMCSVVSRSVIEKLGLSPTGKATVYHTNGVTETFSYLVSVHLPCGINFPYIRVTEGILSVCDVLIGMDIIGHGDFAITAPNGNTKFSFQIPSTNDIDFVKQQQ